MSESLSMTIRCAQCELAGLPEHLITACVVCGWPPALNGICRCGALVVSPRGTDDAGNEPAGMSTT